MPNKSETTVINKNIDECYYCWTRVGDCKLFSSEKIDKLPGLFYHDLRDYSFTETDSEGEDIHFDHGSENTDRNICIDCIKRMIEHYESSVYEKYHTVCAICRKSYPEERKEFKRNSSFGCCGGPTFLCETCKKAGFKVISGTGGPTTYYHNGKEMPSINPYDDIDYKEDKRPYFFSEKTWKYIQNVLNEI